MPVTILSIRHTGQRPARSKMAQLGKAIIAKTGFNPWDPQSGKGELIPSFPLTSTRAKKQNKQKTSKNIVSESLGFYGFYGSNGKS